MNQGVLFLAVNWVGLTRCTPRDQLHVTEQFKVVSRPEYWYIKAVQSKKIAIVIYFTPNRKCTTLFTIQHGRCFHGNPITY